MKKKITLLILILLSGCIVAFAQNSTIKGTIKDNKGDGLPGVTVKVKGTATGTASDINGNYTISAPATGVLIFSSLGLDPQEVEINKRTVINITMTDANKQLQEVVVIGYGTRAVKDVTGSISSIKADKLANDNPTSVTDILKGAIPGLSVAMNTSAKGGSAGDLQLRGQVSLSGNAVPLIVLDGVIYPGQLADINPDDIDRVDVLRDPSALAVYGYQSAGGVVAITTKKGKTAGITISVSANTGISQLEKNQQYYQGTGFLDWRADAARATNTSNPYYFYSNPNNLPAGVTLAQFMNGATGDPTVVWLQRLGLQNNEISNYQAGKVTDWSKLIFRNGIRQDYTASLQGKTDVASYYMSGNFTKNENLIQGGGYKDARFRLNLEGKAAKFLTIGINAQFASRDESDGLNPFNLSGYDLHEADWGQIINASPYGDMYNTDGSLRRIDTDDSGLNFRNPFLGTTYNQNVNIQNELFANLFARVDLPFGIKYSLNFAPQIEAYRNFFFRPVANPNELTGGTATRTMENRFRYNLDNILSWNKTFGIHNFDVTLLLTKNRYQSWYTSTSNTQLSPTDGTAYHSIGAGTLPVESSDDREVDGDGKMARLNYTLLGRYILTGTIRQDGYSPFGLKNPRQTYSSGALAWVLTDEKFMKGDAFKWLDYAKVRVGYGSNGNITGGTPDASVAVAQLYSNYYPTVANGTVTNNITVGVYNLQNADLTWERVTGTNLGLDLTILHGRLNASIDVYNRSTTNQLVKRSIPSVQGFNGTYTGSGSNQSSPLTNIGETQNRGIEISMDGSIIRGKNFSWSANGTFTLNRNKIIHIYGAVPVIDANGNETYVENNDIGNGWFLGHDISAVWDYKITGVWQANEAANAALFTGAGIKPGDFKMEDVDGDHAYTNADKQFLGSTSPSFTWSLRNDFHFLKNFDFSFLLVSSIGQLRKFNQALNSPGSVGFLRQNSYVWPYWTTENPINDFARLSSGSEGTTINVWRKSSFVRIQTVSLGYTFDNSLIKKIGMKSAKIYVNATNPYVMTSWQFWDPQNDGPTPRFLAAGISATF
ncbi:SusC/RagA family TonB-linked outer membrane protein [Mucilaginibacter sp. AW1-3]